MTNRIDSSHATLAILIAACLLGGVVVFFSSWWMPASGSNVNIYQETTSRAFNQELLGDTLFSMSEEGELSDPTVVQMHGGDIYVLDEQVYTLKRFDQEGAYLNNIGWGRGHNRGEVYDPRAFDVVGDHVWVVDDYDSRLQSFSLDGAFVSEIRTESDIRALQFLEDGLISFTPYSEPLFSRLDTNGDQVSTFGEEIAGRTTNPVVRDGQMVTDGDYLLFAPYYAGELYMYDLADGELVNRIRTVDDFAFLGAAGTDAQYRRPGWEIRTRDASLAENMLYVHTWQRDGEKIYSVVDRYSWPEGQYLDSFQLPTQTQSFYASESLYLLADRDSATVTAYERP